MADETNKEEKKADEAQEKSVFKAEAVSAGADKSEESSPEGESVEVPDKFKKLVEEVEQMPVLELNELVKVLEKRFGVSAAAVAVATPGAGGVAEEAEEKNSFTVELKSVGEQKIAVIKVVKEVLSLGLKEAKDMVDGAPSVLKEGVKKEEAEEIKSKIEAAGGFVELK